MKKLLFSLTFGLLAFAPLSAEDFIPWANKFFTLEDTPSVIVHDFGSVAHGTKLKHRFKITNIYKVPIQLVDRPVVSCGCVEPVDWSKQLQSKEEGYLDVTMDASRFTGAKSVTMQVKFGNGASYHSTAIVQLRAFSRGDIVLNPGQIDFGQIAVGQKTTRTVDVSYNGAGKWEVISGEVNDKLIDVKVEAVPGRGIKPTYRVTANLKSEVPAGALQEQIVLKTTDAANPFVTINVNAQVLAPFEVSPKVAKFEELAVGQTASKRIIISANKKFRLEPMESEGITAKVQSNSNTMQIVELQFTAKTPGAFKREITLKTDADEKIAVTIEGSVK